MRQSQFWTPIGGQFWTPIDRDGLLCKAAINLR